MASSSLWQRFQRYFLYDCDLDFFLDISRLKFPEDFFRENAAEGKAFAAMRELEAGAIANPTEKRMVGHYWLRNPALAPTAEIRQEIEGTVSRVNEFTGDIHAGKITGDTTIAASKASDRESGCRSGKDRGRNSAPHRRRPGRRVSSAATFGEQRSTHQGRAWRGAVGGPFFSRTRRLTCPIYGR